MARAVAECLTAALALLVYRAGKGDQEPGRPADDLVLVVSEKPHDRFTRSGNDLVRHCLAVLTAGWWCQGHHAHASLATRAPVLLWCQRVLESCSRVQCCA